MELFAVLVVMSQVVVSLLIHSQLQAVNVSWLLYVYLEV